MNPCNAPVQPCSIAGCRRKVRISQTTQVLHRISAVMESEGVGERAAAQRMNLTVSQVRAESSPSCDLRLSDLYRWHAALRVPVGELLHDSAADFLPAVTWRARMLSLMSTARSIQALTDQDGVHSLAMILAQNLEALMSELNQVPAWTLQDQRRPYDELGRAEEWSLSDDFLDSHIDG